MRANGDPRARISSTQPHISQAVTALGSRQGETGHYSIGLESIWRRRQHLVRR